jgi:PAS domain S-box-containing protein
MVNKCKNAEKLFQIVFDLLPDPTILMDSDSTILAANECFLDTFGLRLEEVPGINFLKLIRTGEVEEEQIREFIKTGMNTDRAIRFEAFVPTGVDSGMWAIIDTRFFRYEGKNIYITVLNNISEQKTQEENLRLSEGKIRTFFDNANDLILSVTADGKISYANQKWMDILGYHKEDWPQLNISDIVHKDERAHIFSVLSRVEQGEKLEFVETIFKTRDGHDVYVEGNVDGCFEYQKFIATRGIFRDITRRKMVEETYRLLVLNFPVPIYILRNGVFCFVNPQFQTDTGYSENELIGQPSMNLVHPDDRLAVRSNAVTLLKSRKVSNYEYRIVCKNGNIRWVVETIISIPYAKGRAVLGTLVDLTERKIIETALEKANERLKEIDRLKDNFLSMVSHELRTPLTSIQSFTDILLKYDENKETRQEFLGIIKEESERLTRLINDFLDISKIQAGRMQWKTAELSIAEVIQSAVSAAKGLIESARLELKIDIQPDLPQVLGDRDRLIQVITNLLGNAYKFTPEGGRITLKARTDNEDRDMVIVSLTDTGAGIAPENYQLIFESFGRVGQAVKDRPKGTGLGLSICKKIIENYRGKIWVESTLGRGSTFFFTLPAVKRNPITLSASPIFSGVQGVKEIDSGLAKQSGTGGN